MIGGLPSSNPALLASRSLAGSYVAWFLRVWGARDVRPWRLRAVFLAGLALICGTTAFVGAVPIRVYGHDTFFLLDNGWRVINGQRPHLDYYSPWGPVTFLVTALGLTISGYSADGIGYGNALVALLVGSWTFNLAKDRVTPPIRLLLSFFLAALIGAPYALGLSPFLSSHAMVYNRYGYALLGLIILESFRSSSREGRDAKAEWIGGVSTGIALSLTLFLKASYFLVALAVLVILAVFFRRLAVQRLAGLCSGCFATVFCMMAYLNFDATAVISDLRMAAGARAEALHTLTPVFWLMEHAWFLLGVLSFSKAASLLFDSRGPRWRGWRLPIAGSFFFFVDLALMSSNAQVGGLPICAVFVLMILSEVVEDQRMAPAQQASMRSYCAAVLYIGPLLCIPLFVSNLTGLAYGAWNKARPSPTALRFTTINLQHLVLYDADGFMPRGNGRVYTTYVNDGVALLERVTDPDEKVLTMDMVNPFPYAMGRRPPRGGLAAMAYHYLLGDGHRPSDEAYFGDADIVMVPKHHSSIDEFYDDFWKAYEEGLRQRYQLIAESDWWFLYRRKQYTQGPNP